MDGNSANEFVLLKSFQFHSTQYTTVSAQVALIRNIPYVGLQRITYPYKDQGVTNPRIKSIYLPLQAWANLVNVVVPQLCETVQNYLRDQPPPVQPTAQRVPLKRLLRDGVFFIIFITSQL